MALRGVVAHAGQGAADVVQGLVVEGPGAVALHQPAGLAQPGGGVVEVDPAALVVAVGEGELDVLDAALESVEGVAGECVGAGGGDSAEGAGGDTDGESARGEPLASRVRGRSLPSGVARWAPLARRERCSGTARSVASPAAVPSWSMASNAATSWARWTTFTSGSSSGRGSALRPEASVSSWSRSVSAAAAAGAGPSVRSAAVPRSDCSSRAWAKAFARRCADTFAITGGTSSRHDGRLPRGSEGSRARTTPHDRVSGAGQRVTTGSLYPAQRRARHFGYGHR